MLVLFLGFGRTVLMLHREFGGWGGLDICSFFCGSGCDICVCPVTID